MDNIRRCYKLLRNGYNAGFNDTSTKNFPLGSSNLTIGNDIQVVAT